jgi:hypothetical protein
MENAGSHGFAWGVYGMCALGIAISVLLPILRELLPSSPRRGESSLPAVWAAARPYIMLGIFSLVGAVLIIAASGDTLKDWRAALLAGYAWDSTLQKLKPLQ